MVTLRLPLEESHRTCTSPLLIVHSEVTEVAQTWCTELKEGDGGVSFVFLRPSPLLSEQFHFHVGDLCREIGGGRLMGYFFSLSSWTTTCQKRKIKTANPNGGCCEKKKIGSRVNDAERRKKGFPSSAFCVFFLCDVNLLKQQNRWQHMDFCPTNRFSFHSPKTNPERVTNFFFSLYVLPAFSFGQILVLFAGSPFFSTSVSLFCF